MASDSNALSRVYIVEDDIYLATALVQCFWDKGVAEVRHNARIKDAMREIAEFRPQLLVLDVHLEDSPDGWGLAEVVGHLYQPVPAIIFSTGAPQVIPEPLRENCRIMEKPFAPEELVALAQSRFALEDRNANSSVRQGKNL